MIKWIKSLFKKDEKLQAVKDNKHLLASALEYTYAGITPTEWIRDGLEATRDFYRLVDMPEALKDVERRIQFVNDTAWLNKFNYDDYGLACHKSSDIFIGRLWRSFDDDYCVAVWDRAANLTELARSGTTATYSPEYEAKLKADTWTLYYFLISDEYAKLEAKYRRRNNV